MILMASSAMAFETHVDILGSLDPKSEMVCITINSCQTCTPILKEKFDDFMADKNNIKMLSKTAIERWENGCKK